MADSIQRQVLDSVVTEITALSLTGVSSGSIVVRKSPFDRDYVHMGITVSWDDNHEGPSRDSPTNLRDMIGYVVDIYDITGSGQGNTEAITAIALRRQKIFRKFSRKRPTITGDTDVNLVQTTAKWGKPTVPKQYQENYDVSMISVTYWVLEPRS